jgi:hypothetical protein
MGVHTHAQGVQDCWARRAGLPAKKQPVPNARVRAHHTDMAYLQRTACCKVVTPAVG